ncbi:MAG: hypothetical protein SFY32_07160 [Bacteroidota bacterium]|nr:hypothetical protein [Bacteroidota bacterium]
MTQNIPLEAYQVFFKVYVREDAEILSKAFSESISFVEKRSEEISFQRKLELKEELKSELATKHDIEILKKEIIISEQKVDKKVTIWSIVIIAVIIITNINSIEFLARIIGFVK